MPQKIKLNFNNNTEAIFTDPETGLYNQSFFYHLVEREILRSQRFGKPFTFALIEVNPMSNKDHEHGKHILRTFAGLMQKSLREVDVAARVKENLFGILLINCDINADISVFERIKKISQTRFGETVTLSIGIVNFMEDAIDNASLMQKAYEALSKSKGSNEIYSFKPIQIMKDQKTRILLVDDEHFNIELLEDLLIPLNFEVISASNGSDALKILNRIEIDLVLLDVMMPGIDGFELCTNLKNNEITRMIPIVIVSALDDIESRIKGIEAGADDFIVKPFNSLDHLARIKSLLKVKKLNKNLTSIENVLFSLAHAIEAKDQYTEGHIHRVANIAVMIGKKLALSSEELESLRLGGILHDIGKIGIPNNILNKPGALTPEEWEIIKTHPDAGTKICMPLKNMLGPALDIIRHHHEKLDGSGYPDGLKDGEISVVARIMAVADIYDALTTVRPYRLAMTKDKAISILLDEANSGALDKNIVACFVNIIR